MRDWRPDANRAPGTPCAAPSPSCDAGYPVQSSCAGEVALQFTLQFHPSLAEYFLRDLLLFLVPVGLPLWLWLRRSPRNARDVLLAVMRTPAGLLRRGVGFVAWLIPAASLVGLQSLGMLAAFWLLWLLVQYGSLDADENLTWLIAPMLAAGTLLLVWMRAPRAAQDVLHIGGRPSPRRR